MIELGKRDEIFGEELLRDLGQLEMTRCFSGYGSGRPTDFPQLREGDSLICGYDQGLGEHLFVCESLEDMQHLYDAYARGGALHIRWYTGEDAGFIAVIVSLPS
jgi:hypothetical protein